MYWNGIKWLSEDVIAMSLDAIHAHLTKTGFQGHINDCLNISDGDVCFYQLVLILWI